MGLRYFFAVQAVILYSEKAVVKHWQGEWHQGMCTWCCGMEGKRNSEKVCVQMCVVE